MALALMLLPLVFAALAALIPSNRARPFVLPVAGSLHFILALVAAFRPGLDAWPNAAFSPDSWLALDPPGAIVLVAVSGLFFFCSLYAVPYLRLRRERSNRVFCLCLLIFVSAASLAAFARHLGLLWVAIEATTLATAPLIYFNRSKKSIEATWKYLLVCSVGIALALLGTFFLAYACFPANQPSMLLDRLVAVAPALSKPWLRAAFILFLVGYGTKMGLAPMHTWKPDAYGEAPGLVGAIFAGAVTSCAFLALMRIERICVAAGEGDYSSTLLIGMGLFSMAVAGFFLIDQRDFKRSLAYSSIEHMGILSLGLGAGGLALFGCMLHILTNGVAKALLFLSAGNIHRAFGSKSTDEVQGSLRTLPISSTLFILGFLAITGSPPFGPFLSIYTILQGILAKGQWTLAAVFLILLLLVFIGMGRTVIRLCYGRPRLPPTSGGTRTGPGRSRIDLNNASTGASAAVFKDSFANTAPLVALLALTLALGLWLPDPLVALLKSASAFVGGSL